MDFLFPFCNIAIHKTTPKFVNCAIYFIYFFIIFLVKPSNVAGPGVKARMNLPVSGTPGRERYRLSSAPMKAQV